MINRNMRLLVMFDLPVTTKADRREYADFRHYLIKSGFFMLQFSIYTRVTQNHDAARKYISDLKAHLPSKGSVRVLQVTEKQFASMQLLVGTKTANEDFLAPLDILEI